VPQILKVAPGASSEEEELDFELAYQRSLSTAERFEMMLSRSRQIAAELIRLGHRKPAEIVIRGARSEFGRRYEAGGSRPPSPRTRNAAYKRP